SSRLHLVHCRSYFSMPRQYLSCPHFLHLKSSPHFNDARYFTQLSSSGKRSSNSNKDRLLNRFSITSCLCDQYSGFFGIGKVPSSKILISTANRKAGKLLGEK